MAIIVLVFSRAIPLFNRFGNSFNDISNYSDFIDKLYLSKSSLEKEKRIIVNKDDSNFKDEIITWSKVKFLDVEFSYEKSKKPALKKINLEISKGLHYAFVGYSGSGKSTTIDLFIGLLEPTKGKILIDQTNLKDFGSRKWQKKISYVPQDPLIADLSLRENIAFGIPNELIDNDKIMDCIEKTHLLGVAKSLEKGIYTNLGNKGINLSGGQKQRVAIARALYQNSEILVLDEATSSLDNRTEELIQETIKNLDKKMTILSIAHRFSTIKNCDYIFLLDNGLVKERGTFEHMKNNGLSFQELAKMQIN
jgi:HlyD family secretion protein